MNFEVTIRGETLEELRENLRKFWLADLTTTPRRKVVPGENIPDGLKEVQSYLKQVEDSLGKHYVTIILERIPCSGIASLKPSEFQRCIRLCQHYLNEPRS